MAELHEALKYLGPVDFSTVPTAGEELDTYLADLFTNSQLVIDSVPIPSPEDAPIKPVPTPQKHASKASEVSLSAERPPLPPLGHDKFQKEWGKPLKVKAAENALGISMYKMSGKDSRGSWFGRRSIHEGIGFSKFKKSLEMEFEKSLAEEGPPGTGSVRGIGGEERVEQIKRDQGTLEVYRLSAQFPGPTAARDFVTMLVTSKDAMKDEAGSSTTRMPRHYMIISRPCDHPTTQPRSGFVRGYYESVEFIREVPRTLKASQSSTELSSEDTVDPHDPEENPVEWIMITRSDPGGGIPRFLVERGTPGSICTDAVKFINWACTNEVDAQVETETSDKQKRPPVRKDSHQSWRGRSLAGLNEDEHEKEHNEPAVPDAEAVAQDKTEAQQPRNGLLATAASTLRPYTPEVILNRMPGALVETEPATADKAIDDPPVVIPERSIEDPPVVVPTKAIHADHKSISSASSFASAEDHWSSEEDGKGSLGSGASGKKVDGKDQTPYEKELSRLDARKIALDKKFADTRARYDAERTKQADADAQQTQKSIDKHERDLKKHEEKYKKELAKIEEKQEKEKQKAQDKAKKEADKDVHTKLRRERDEAREELGLAKKETESLRKMVSELQKENTDLVMKLGKAGIESEGKRSRSSTLSHKDKKDLLGGSGGASVKSGQSATSSNQN